MLQPKKVRWRKVQKGRIKGIAQRGFTLSFGSFGIKTLEIGRLTSRQIEAARQAIVRKLNRKGKLWIRVFPSIPITAKPIEVRMGKGKGALSHWGVKVSAGTVLFEICGISKSIAITAFKTGGAKLPVRTIILS